MSDAHADDRRVGVPVGGHDGGSAEVGNGSGDSVTAGLTAFVQAVETKPPEPTGPGADPKVSVAFALGWQMAELYRATAWRTVPAPTLTDLPEDLPGLSGLDRAQRAGLGLDQVDVALSILSNLMTCVGLTVPNTAAARTAAQTAVDDTFRLEIVDLHILILSALTAADFKLGKAYGLGRALADTSMLPRDLTLLRAQLETHRIANLLAWISDLTSAFPAHAGHSVGASVERWRDWAATRDSPGANDPERAVGLLRRQGQRWRALLSGEKEGTDLLEVQDYVSAGFGMIKRLGALTVRYLVPFLPLVVVAVGLFVGGIALLLDKSNSSHIAAGIAGLLASAGLTWKGVGASLGRAATRIERPLWEAELDLAITDAVTLLPGSKRAEKYTPPEIPAAAGPEQDPMAPARGATR